MVSVHIGKEILGESRKHWIDNIFGFLKKMHNTGTLICPISRSKLPTVTNILPAKFLFEVKIINIAHFYELNSRFFANSLRQLEGIGFKASFAHEDDNNSFRFMIVIIILE